MKASRIRVDITGNTAKVTKSTIVAAVRELEHSAMYEFDNSQAIVNEVYSSLKAVVTNNGCVRFTLPSKGNPADLTKVELSIGWLQSNQEVALPAVLSDLIVDANYVKEVSEIDSFI